RPEAESLSRAAGDHERKLVGLVSRLASAMLEEEAGVEPRPRVIDDLEPERRAHPLSPEQVEALLQPASLRLEGNSVGGTRRIAHPPDFSGPERIPARREEVPSLFSHTEHS